MQGTSHITNLLCRTCPRAGQKIVIRLLDDQPNQIFIYGPVRLFGEHQFNFLVTSAMTSTMTFPLASSMRTASAMRYLFTFGSDMSHPCAPIYEIEKGRNNCIKGFYYRLWFGDEKELPDLDVRDTFTSPEVTISVSNVEVFCAVVGNQKEFKAVRTDGADSSLAGQHCGDTYIDGIQPVFDALKACHFDSSWNWARHDAILVWKLPS